MDSSSQLHTPTNLAPAEIAHVVLSVGDWVGPIACLDTLGEIETFASAGN